jgi:hypothetical protein
MEEDLVPYVSKVGLDLAMHWWLLTNITFNNQIYDSANSLIQSIAIAKYKQPDI